ncbi:MAG: hypothetical protein R3E58_19900 [Phycisphaerae bacterium]
MAAIASGRRIDVIATRQIAIDAQLCPHILIFGFANDFEIDPWPYTNAARFKAFDPLNEVAGGSRSVEQAKKQGPAD